MHSLYRREWIDPVILGTREYSGKNRYLHSIKTEKAFRPWLRAEKYLFFLATILAIGFGLILPYAASYLQ